MLKIKWRISEIDGELLTQTQLWNRRDDKFTCSSSATGLQFTVSVTCDLHHRYTIQSRLTQLISRS